LQRDISHDGKEPSVSANLSSETRLEGIRVVSGGVECCYQLEKESVGNLVKVVHRETRKKFWVQTIALKQTKSTQIKQQLALLRSPSHQNVLTLLDLFQDDTYLYAVYEATDGGNAKELSERLSGVSEQWAAAIMQQVFSALNYCHSEGLVLKSLSLQHILFTELPTEDNFCVKLLIPLGEKLEKNSPYMAPELKNKKHAGPVNDMWSAGIILSSLIAGQCVFMNMQASITSQEFRRAYTKWHDVSKPVKSLTLALIARNYSKRPTPEQCLKHSWIARIS
jgi:calcium-dependent protein kinase